MTRPWAVAWLLLVTAPAVAGSSDPHEANLIRRHSNVMSTSESSVEFDAELPDGAQPAIPTRAEALAATAAWEERVAADNREGWSAKLREHLSPEARSARRRRTQAGVADESLVHTRTPFGFNLSAVSGSSAEQLALGAAVAGGSGCEDSLATNAGGGDVCRYDCETLLEFFFPGDAAATAARCFAYDPDAGSWPAELLGMRQTSLDWHAYLPPAAALAAENFTVGGGDECVNVTIQTTALQPGDTAGGGTANATRTEVRCLMQGFHEYNHTLNSTHSVDVVGYAQSGIHNGSGATTAFVVGECTDVVIRVNTTSSASGSVLWQINDNHHNGPWDFNSVPGVWEHRSCMFENHFTINRVDSENDGWTGTIAIFLRER